MGLLTGTVQNWLAVQNVIRILVTIYIQNLLPACRPIFKAVRGSYAAVLTVYRALWVCRLLLLRGAWRLHRTRVLTHRLDGGWPDSAPHGPLYLCCG
jgi:hypothetical protein